MELFVGEIIYLQITIFLITITANRTSIGWSQILFISSARRANLSFIAQSYHIWSQTLVQDRYFDSRIHISYVKIDPCPFIKQYSKTFQSKHGVYLANVGGGGRQVFIIYLILHDFGWNQYFKEKKKLYVCLTPLVQNFLILERLYCLSITSRCHL